MGRRIRRNLDSNEHDFCEWMRPVGHATFVYRDQTNGGLTFRSAHPTPPTVKTRKLLAWVPMPPLADILHRTLVVGLLGMTVAGVGVGWGVHKDTLRRGQGSSAAVIVLQYALCVFRSAFRFGGNASFKSFSFPCVHLWFLAVIMG